MENKKLKWCFRIREGIKIVEPNSRISDSYLEQAKSSLLRAEKDFKDNDFCGQQLRFTIQNIMLFILFFKKSG